MKELDRLVEIMRRLRGPGGCPWDREQTLESLKPYLLEEAYETLEAMDEGGDALKGELGDLLLQVIFQAQICEEKGEFSLEDVIEAIGEKMIRRHPHVFGDIEVKDSNEVLINWEKIKKDEREHRDRISVLDGIPKGMPALMRAEKIQKKAAKTGFDWERVTDVLDKVEEEIKEFREALNEKNRAEMKNEFGDILFSLVNLARHLEINSTESLISTTNKFEERFRYVESKCDLSESSLEKMEKLWEEAKKKEKKSN